MNDELLRTQSELSKIATKEFNDDSRLIGKLTDEFLRLIYPAYFINSNNIEQQLDHQSALRLDGITYFRISCCTIDTVDKIFETINIKIEKLFIALHSIGVSIGYGLISRDGVTHLVLGVYSNKDIESVKKITQGMLPGIEMDNYVPDFSETTNHNMSYGILSGLPSVYIGEQKQTFSLSSIMRSLNGRDYTVLFIAKPVSINNVTQKISDLITIRDHAFSVSKRNIARSSSSSDTSSHTHNISEGKNSTAGPIAGGVGTVIGSIVGSIIPGLGTVLGAITGGGLGTIIGNIIGGGETHSEGYSDSISKAITEGETVSCDIQNSFAVELMNYVDKSIERLKIGQNNGVWQTAITYSADSDISRNIIKACLCGELSKPDPDKLPLISFEPNSYDGELLRIPDFLAKEIENPLCTYINSAELGLLCTVPTENVPDFELRIEKSFPFTRSELNSNSIMLGHITNNRKMIPNMPFTLMPLDLNKHLFVCGITGSGKTTTVKKILIEAKKPFLVIESAKKEYRNLSTGTNVYTLGKPELNCPQINPFYIMPGVSPQAHIDYLKDLFNASFSFYGPMPYILEKCLHTIYENKGWDLTLGYHPMLANSKSIIDFYDIGDIKKKYAISSHKYLFPTMQELKNEITRYIEEELKYDSEIASNIKTAMKVRLENLCIGAKGFTYNTSEYLDLPRLLEQQVVFELEGLSDDSDKAFSVGLLVIFINEYRQITKEIHGNKKMGLKHLLVIEEAHRLLKNINTEQSSEVSGNPKGKAVEHFTNMIAEMRSYGQGVIVAEQIPTKLAPDVIKNSSTKIIHRIVSSDDQKIIANTIGISGDDALQLGTLLPGYAFCHKEGMSLPTIVKISNTFKNNENTAQELDFFVSDEELYNKQDDRFLKINLSRIKSILEKNNMAKIEILSLINTLCIESSNDCILSCHEMLKKFRSIIDKSGVSLLFCDDIIKIISQYMSELFIRMITCGLYCVNSLPTNKFTKELDNLFFSPTHDKIESIKRELSKLYKCDLPKFAKENIVSLIKRSLKKDTDIKKTIESYFSRVSLETLNEIAIAINKGEIIE